jgi:hypothetical protein
MIVILFGQMSELHQFGFLELFRELLQTFNRPNLLMKKTKKAPQAFKDFCWLEVPKIPSKDVTCMPVRHHD